MKRILTALLITFVFVCSAQAQSSHKVLKIIDSNSFYIDLNDNKQADSNELMHIKGITTFADYPSDESKLQAKSFNLTEKQILGLGYLSRWFTRRELQYNSVTVTFDDSGDLVSISYFKNGQYKKYEQAILQEGLATSDNHNLKNYFNEAAFKNNIEYVNKFNLVFVNKRTGMIYPLEKREKDSKNIELIDENFFKQFFAPANLYADKNTKYVSHIVKSKDGEISLYFTDPTVFQRPQRGCQNDNCKVLVDMINNSQTYIKFAIYGFSGQPEVLEALKKAEKRGVKVYGIVDMDIKGYNVYPETQTLLASIKNIHTDYENDLKANEKRIQKVKQLQLEDPTKDFDIRSAIMHNKFFIVDGKYLWTGSTNVTENCLSYNSNVSVVMNAPQIAEIYENEFNQMYFDGNYHKSKQENTLQKNNIKINKDTTVSVYFSPQDKAITNAIIPLINKTEHYIYTPIFYLTHKGVIQSLLNAKQRGVEVKVIIDANSASNNYSKHHMLRENGIEVKTENWGGKMHMKSLVADDKYLVIASMNWTNSAENTNDENTIVIENKELALQFKNEFLRLWKSIPDKWLRNDPKAESFDSVNSCFDGVDNNHNGVYDFDEYACGSVMYDKINSYYQNRSH